MADAELVAGGGEGRAPVAAAVVGEDPLDRDPVGRRRTARRGAGRRPWLPATRRAALPRRRAWCGRRSRGAPGSSRCRVNLRLDADAVRPGGRRPRRIRPELLGVEVDELARVARARSARWAVGARGGRGATEALPPQERVDRGTGEPGLPGRGRGDRLAARAAWRTARRRATAGCARGWRWAALLAVAESRLALAPEPADPFGAGLAADPGGRRRLRDRPASSDTVDQQMPTPRGQARTSMGHEGSLRRLRLQHQKPNDRGPQPVDNPIGN